MFRILEEHYQITQLKQRNEVAFRWLVDNYRNRIHSVALNILQNTDEAEDTAQETFIQVFESIHSFKGNSSLSTWIHKIAVNTALNKLRSKKRRQNLQKILPWWMPAEAKSNETFFQHPGIALEKKEKAAILFKAVETLPEKQRIAFTLIKVQGMSYDEASTIMQQGIKSLESLIVRANNNLQKELESYYTRINQ